MLFNRKTWEQISTGAEGGGDGGWGGSIEDAKFSLSKRIPERGGGVHNKPRKSEVSAVTRSRSRGARRVPSFVDVRPRTAA